MPRTFVAIELPSSMKEKIKNISHGITGARWTPMDQLHLTLRFIGDISEKTMGRVHEALSRVRAAQLCFSLKSVGCFPARKRPRVLWVGIDNQQSVMQLQSHVEAAVQSAGVEAQQRAFHPHITVARFRNGSTPAVVIPFLQQHALFATESTSVTRFALFSSKLTPRGAVHTKEHEYAFTHTGM
jgi:2'-5' RNA ligase